MAAPESGGPPATLPSGAFGRAFTPTNQVPPQRIHAALAGLATVAAAAPRNSAPVHPSRNGRATSPLVAYIDTGVTGLPVTPNGGDIAVAWNASGIFAL